MKFPLLASFIVFLIFFTFDTKRRWKKEKKMKDDYWENERRANTVRRKPLDNLNYIEIPLDRLPVTMLADLPEIQEFTKKLHTLSEKKIVNFTGYTNTELKLEYGAPNINLLSEYDQNFTELVTSLQAWADFLMQDPIFSKNIYSSLEEQTTGIPASPDSEGQKSEISVNSGLEEQKSETSVIPPLSERKSAAKNILEYAVSIGSDISASYETLLKLYQENNEPEKIIGLKKKAEELRSLSKGKILAMLETPEIKD